MVGVIGEDGGVAALRVDGEWLVDGWMGGEDEGVAWGSEQYASELLLVKF